MDVNACLRLVHCSLAYCDTVSIIGILSHILKLSIFFSFFFAPINSHRGINSHQLILIHTIYDQYLGVHYQW